MLISTGSMSYANNLSKEVQFRYLVQWFNEWSELQRSDFLPIFAERLGSSKTSPVYLNGVVNSMSAVMCEDKPLNLFYCRVKLFHNWTVDWTDDDITKLSQKLTEIDPAFGEKLAEELKQATVETEIVDINELTLNEASDAEIIPDNVDELVEPVPLEATVQREMIEA